MKKKSDMNSMRHRKKVTEIEFEISSGFNIVISRNDGEEFIPKSFANKLGDEMILKLILTLREIGEIKPKKEKKIPDC